MPEEMKYYSLLLSWNENDSEEGEFTWSGWASSDQEAELFARQEMYVSCLGLPEDAPDEGVWEKGHVLDFEVGANTSAAPAVADIIAELISTPTAERDEARTYDQLVKAMELLRPGYTEIQQQSAQADVDCTPAPSL